MLTRLPLRAVVALALLAGLVAPGLALSARATTRPSVRSATLATAPVVVYGDSISVQTAPFLPQTYAVDALWGRDTGPTVARLVDDMRARWSHLPRVVVMAIGSNDLDHPELLTYYVRLVRGFLPPSVALVWVDVYRSTMPAWVEANAAIVQGARTAPLGRAVRVLDWAGELAAKTRAGTHFAKLLSDGTHVTAAGAFLRATLTHRAVASALG